MSKTYGFNRVDMARNLSLDELEQLVKQVEVEHANEFKDGRYYENGQVSLSLYDKKGMKKLDAIGWAIYSKTKVGAA